MSKPQETFERAYGNVPKEVGPSFSVDWIPSFRGFKYFYLKFIRYITR